MPPIPPVNVAPRDSVNSVLNAARFRLNDKLASLYPFSGKILDEYQAGTQQAFNNGYRRLQNELKDAAIELFSDEIVIIGIPPVTNFDPSSTCSMSFTEFFDGTTYQNSPVLPKNLLIPLWMSERQSGTNLPFPPVNRPNMRNYVDGLPGNGKWIFNRAWEWRGEKIVFPGAMQTVDFRIRFRATLPFIGDVGNLAWFQQDVPILDCGDALAWWVCYEFSVARMADGDVAEGMAAVAETFKENAESATTLMMNQTAMKNQRTNVRQLPYGGGHRRW